MTTLKREQSGLFLSPIERGTSSEGKKESRSGKKSVDGLRSRLQKGESGVPCGERSRPEFQKKPGGVHPVKTKG